MHINLPITLSVVPSLLPGLYLIDPRNYSADLMQIVGVDTVISADMDRRLFAVGFTLVSTKDLPLAAPVALFIERRFTSYVFEVPSKLQGKYWHDDQYRIGDK